MTLYKDTFLMLSIRLNPNITVSNRQVIINLLKCLIWTRIITHNILWIT